MATVNQKIIKAFSDNTGNSSMVHLNTRQADAFIDYIKDESVILKNSRIKKMNAPMENIAKLGVGEEVFFPAKQGSSLDETKRVNFSGEQIKLVTKEIMAEVKILDDELEDNIEGMSFREHLMRMISKKGANQLERAALYSRETENGDSINSLFNGFIKTLDKSGTVLDANAETDRFVSKDKLAKLYKALPTKYRSSLNKFYMPNDVAIDYETLYEATSNDINKKGAFGISFENAPLMSIERPVAVKSGFSATLGANTVKWESVITLSKTTGLTAGKEIAIALDNDKQFATKVVSVDGTAKTATLEDALPFDYSKDLSEENEVSEVTLDGADIILTDASNLIWGIQRDITIETERSARERATYFVVTLRCDFAVENPQAAGLLKNIKIK